MFELFKKKTEIEKLEIKYKSLLKESYDLSKLIEVRATKKHLKRRKYLNKQKY